MFSVLSGSDAFYLHNCKVIKRFISESDEALIAFHLIEDFSVNPLMLTRLSEYDGIVVSLLEDRYLLYDSANVNNCIFFNSDFSQSEVSRHFFGSSRFMTLLLYAFKIRALFINSLMTHAASVVLNDKAYLFSGPSGIGKSTQARLFCQFNKNAWVLNFDKPLLLCEDNSYFVYGTPWGGKESICLLGKYPLKYIFFLYQGKRFSIQKLTNSEFFSLAYMNYYVYPAIGVVPQMLESSVINLITNSIAYRVVCTGKISDTEMLMDEIGINL